jgi:hypothetical protein
VMVRWSFGAGFCAASGAAAASDIASTSAAFTLRRRPVGPTVAATRRGIRFWWLMPRQKCRFRARAQPESGQAAANTWSTQVVARMTTGSASRSVSPPS